MKRSVGVIVGLALTSLAAWFGIAAAWGQEIPEGPERLATWAYAAVATCQWAGEDTSTEPPLRWVNLTIPNRGAWGAWSGANVNLQARSWEMPLCVPGASYVVNPYSARGLKIQCFQSGCQTDPWGQVSCQSWYMPVGEQAWGFAVMGGTRLVPCVVGETYSLGFREVDGGNVGGRF